MPEVDAVAQEAKYQKELLAMGFKLENQDLQMLIEGEARTLIAKAQAARLVTLDVQSTVTSEVNDVIVKVDAMLLVALDSLKGAGVERPLAPLAWELFEQANLQPDEGNTIWMLGSRASNSLGLASEFLGTSDVAAKEQLRARLKARGLIRVKR